MTEHMNSKQSQLLAKGLGILLGEAVFAVNGPFLFCRFGLNVPLAAAAGCLVGAHIGYFVTALMYWVRNWRPVVTPLPMVKHGPKPHPA